MVYILNLPDQSQNEFKRLRVPITVINKKHMCQENGFSTMDGILEVVAWSFRCLLAGKFPLKGFHGVAREKGQASRLAFGLLWADL